MTILWDFVTEETRRVERFEDWWAHQHTLKPEDYPMWLKDGDWDEQYRTWCDSEFSAAPEDFKLLEK